MLVVGTFAELFSNDRPLVARYQGEWFFPIFNNQPETRFGGDFATPTDWHDPFIREQFAKPGNFALFTFNQFGAGTLDYYARARRPGAARPAATGSAPTQSGRDMTARLLYGFRVSIYFGLALTFVGTVLGILDRRAAGLFRRPRRPGHAARHRDLERDARALPADHHRVDLRRRRCCCWSACSRCSAGSALSDYVRAEFLRNRNLEFVKAARAMGLSNGQIIWRHVLPNSMTPVITFLPFRMSAAILVLDRARLPRPGRARRCRRSATCCAQGKDNLDAWWISLPTFIVLVADAAAADLHRRRAARRLRHAEVMSDDMPRAPLLAVDDALRQLRRRRASSTACRSTIGAGEKFALVGESGSGKSVTALSILQLVEAATLRGRDPLRGRERAARRASASCRRCAAATSR